MMTSAYKMMAITFKSNPTSQRDKTLTKKMYKTFCVKFSPIIEVMNISSDLSGAVVIAIPVGVAQGH